MMRLWCAAALLSADLLTGRPAAADPQGYFGNVLTITRQGLLAGVVVYRRDHSYTMVTTRRTIVDGSWNVAAGKLCLKPKRAEQAMMGLCVPDDPLHKVGDSWWVSPGGKPEQLDLIPGP